jgi:protein CWC15
MTTAHRPTYNPTKGGSIQGANKFYFPSQLYSSKDLPSNLNIKTRRIGQGSIKEVNRQNFKKELMEREKKNVNKGLVSSLYSDFDELSSNVDITTDLLKIGAPIKKQKIESENFDDISEIKSQVTNNLFSSNKDIEDNKDDINNVFIQDKDLEFEDSDDENKGNKLNVNHKGNFENSDEDGDNKYDRDEEEEDDEDEEELLFREYEKIKIMKEEENRQKEIEHAEKLKRQVQEQILVGNPLLNNQGYYSLKKKWFEDTIFKNQAKNEPKTKKRFINDTVRSDFHRKFLSKTVQ